MKRQKRFLTNADVVSAVKVMRQSIYGRFGMSDHFVANPPRILHDPAPLRIYGVPRGGVPVAFALTGTDNRFQVVDDPDAADLIIDDVIDSGRTKNKFVALYYKPFFALADFLQPRKNPGEWLVFPWESGLSREDRSAEDVVLRLLQFIGEDSEREGLKDTPKRVLRAWEHWCSGYSESPEEVLKTFGDGAEDYDQMITVKDIPFYSMCEHHLAPFFGTATIAYIPDKRVVGLSKLSRVVDVYARRLQVQERMTTQVADCLQDNLIPKGVGVLVKARHLCMESRGISKQGHVTVTTALRGEFLGDHKVRDEFLSISR